MKEKILSATAELIAQKGVKSASTRAICGKLNISAPTLYHYFTNKSDLLEAVTSYSFDQHMNSIHWNPQDTSYLESLEKAWDQYIDFALNQSDLYRVMVTSVANGFISESGYRCFQNLIDAFGKAELQGRLTMTSMHAAQIYLSTAQGLAVTLLSLADTSVENRMLLSKQAREILLKQLLK